MPTYDYECDACRHKFEQWQSFHDDHLTTCPARDECEAARATVVIPDRFP